MPGYAVAALGIGGAGPVGPVVAGVGDAPVPGAEAVTVFEEHGVGEAPFLPGMVDAHRGFAALRLVKDLARALQLVDEAAVEQQLAAGADQYGCVGHWMGLGRKMIGTPPPSPFESRKMRILSQIATFRITPL